MTTKKRDGQAERQTLVEVEVRGNKKYSLFYDQAYIQYTCIFSVQYTVGSVDTELEMQQKLSHKLSSINERSTQYFEYIKHSS